MPSTPRCSSQRALARAWRSFDRAVAAADDGMLAVAANLRGSGRAQSGREAGARQQAARLLRVAARGAERGAVGRGALVRIVLGARDQAIRVAARASPGVGAAVRRGRRVDPSAHAGADVLAAARLRDARCRRPPPPPASGRPTRRRTRPDRAREAHRGRARSSRPWRTCERPDRPGRRRRAPRSAPLHGRRSR